jgi:hypothetical protein
MGQARGLRPSQTDRTVPVTWSGDGSMSSRQKNHARPILNAGSVPCSAFILIVRGWRWRRCATLPVVSSGDSPFGPRTSTCGSMPASRHAATMTATNDSRDTRHRPLGWRSPRSMPRSRNSRTVRFEQPSSFAICEEVKATENNPSGWSSLHEGIVVDIRPSFSGKVGSASSVALESAAVPSLIAALRHWS